MITPAQLRAARALLGIDQTKLAELSGLSVPTIQRMEASGELIRGNVDSLMKLIAALDGGRHRADRRGCCQPRRRPRGATEGSTAVDPGRSGGTRQASPWRGSAGADPFDWPRPMSVEIALSAVVALLAVAALAVWRSRSRRACRLVYGTCLAVSSLVLLAALAQLLGLAGPPATLTLPLGVPWIGAQFRIDALAAFFLVVVNLGGAAASLYGLGYGRHETAPERVLPFFPAFLAAMNLVVLAHDAFTFLLAWEFMSLASWALVVSHHRESDNTRAGYVYLAMASFGTLALLLAFGLLAGPAGAYDFAAMREADHGAADRRPGARPGAPRRRLQGRASCRCTSGCRWPTRQPRATSRP
jgi:hypothetical protein